MSDGYHFHDCPSRRGSPTCECRYRGVEIEKALGEALHEAVEVLWFDDNSDYGSSLWRIVTLLGGEKLADLLEEDEEGIELWIDAHSPTSINVEPPKKD